MDLKAYHVQEDYEASCCIIFDTNGASARRRGANELNVEWEDVAFCRRAPWADEYADRREIPPQVMLEQGWRLACGCCGNWIEQDLIDDPEDDCAPVYVGSWIYYNAEHHDRDVAEAKEEKDLELATRAEAAAKFPGAEVIGYFKRTTSGGGWAPTATLRVPGLQGRVDWQRGADFVHVAKRDEDAWKAFAAKLKEPTE